MTSSSTSFSPCGICGIDRKEQYTCPKCSTLYCSLKCYRNEKHAECSEKFYQEHVKQELAGKRFDSSQTSDEHREKMQKFLQGDWSGIEEGEPLDSDDEEQHDQQEGGASDAEERAAQKKVIESTIDDYELDEAEIDRRMVAMGLSDDVDELLNTLTPEEREMFRQLAGEMQEEEHGFGESVFR